MRKKIIRLTESDLIRLVKRVIRESEFGPEDLLGPEDTIDGGIDPEDIDDEEYNAQLLDPDEEDYGDYFKNKKGEYEYNPDYDEDEEEDYDW